MKLAEIFARELGQWPGEAIRASYGADMNVYFEKIDGGIIETSYFTRGVDIPPFDVTRPQWQAERDRIKAMEEISKFSQEQDQLQHPASTTYEQQLWDRVASDGFVAYMQSDTAGEFSAQIHAECACDNADAFMAERAKRVGK